MTILQTQGELRMAEHRDGLHFRCGDCGGVFPVQTSGGTGYAYTEHNNTLAKPICYPCADKRQVEELKDRSKPFCGYLTKDKDGKLRISTWTGGLLMNVTDWRPCRLTRQSFTHDRNGYKSVHAVDVHGGHWTGRGSVGVAIRMRPVKG